MNHEQFLSLPSRAEIVPTFAVSDLSNREDRTLLYGYDCDRATWHVYLKDGEIVLHVYYYDGRGESVIKRFGAVVADANALIPNKRLYPAACDAEACRILLRKGMSLPFTTFEAREEKQFYGEVV